MKKEQLNPYAVALVIVAIFDVILTIGYLINPNGVEGKFLPYGFVFAIAFLFKSHQYKNELLNKEAYEKAVKEDKERRGIKEVKKVFVSDDANLNPNSIIPIEVKVVPVKLESEADKIRKSVEAFKVDKETTSNKIKERKDADKKVFTPIVEEGKSKAEKAGNTTKDENGKTVVKPNYKSIASEWVKDNIDLLNKICNDAYAISGGSGSYSATIPMEYLPTEKATWVIIGTTLVAEDEVSSFKIVSDGLEVSVD